MAVFLGRHVRVTRSEYADLHFRAAAAGLKSFVPVSIRSRGDYEQAIAAARGSWWLWDALERMEKGGAQDLASELTPDELYAGRLLPGSPDS